MSDTTKQTPAEGTDETPEQRAARLEGELDAARASERALDHQDPGYAEAAAAAIGEPDEPALAWNAGDHPGRWADYDLRDVPASAETVRLLRQSHGLTVAKLEGLETKARREELLVWGELCILFIGLILLSKRVNKIAPIVADLAAKAGEAVAS